MSLFNEIAGLKGENLSSALLAHLLLRSPAARDAFIKKISDISPIGPIYRQKHFAVFCEQHAEWEAEGEEGGGRGRLDLVIETDDAVIGIENKFYAPFQDNQPKCYFPHLEKTCKSLKALRGTDFRPLLIVLAPESRKSEVEHCLDAQAMSDKADFLSWKELLQVLSELKGASAVDEFLVRELENYVKDQIGRFLDIPRLLPHLKKRWSDRGTSAHHQFLNRFIWSLLGDSVKGGGQNYSSGVGKNYYGWYLYPNPNRQKVQFWLGFMRHLHGDAEAGLFVAVKPREAYRKACVQEKSQTQEEIEMPSWHEYDWGCFRIPFRQNTEWKEPDTWAAALKPLNQLLEKESKREAEPTDLD